nr:hypothetical protein [Tanacetum cinerariifolium]
MGDRVMRNNSQGKKHDVEDQRRNAKLLKYKTSVTACNDSLNAKTLNVNSISTMCDKCVLIDKHDMCVLNSVAKPIMKTVASESNQKPRNITRKLYERVSKTCSWWYPKFTPSGYKLKPKSGKENVNPNTSMPLGSVSRTANILEHMTSRKAAKLELQSSFKSSPVAGDELQSSFKSSPVAGDATKHPFAKHAPPVANPKPKAPNLKPFDITKSNEEEGDGSGSEEEGDEEEDEKKVDEEEDEEEGDEEEDEEDDEKEGNEEEDEKEEEDEEVDEEDAIVNDEDYKEEEEKVSEEEEEDVNVK